MSANRPRVLNFITSNRNKLAEATAILRGCVELRSQSVDVLEIQGTPRDIAADKCRRAAIAVNGPALVEDTALEFHALNGMPGPYMYVIPLLPASACLTPNRPPSRPFFSAVGNDGLRNLLAAYEDKSATSVCTLAYCRGPGEEPVIFEGRCTGTIVPPRGSNGFAYDPIFEHEGQTFAEMDPMFKNQVSDRYRALQKLRQWLEGATD
ncbi:Inosine triphosphate pyrophosphatase [Lasiodiplodia theobromae]|uniref:Inosine triphosphate pyrophosphatase n=1 Tax=Lasiodiplodia theobromae TaxID=45133 RepID=UPI0015C3ACD2|nr:Inosine triphosphate pyrophosphatase [Lasiodiplodia theobromae]KAF4539604.1 Inosine triphosphate pyrophosphatase [Lasiodiplodia theobromae]